jgi:hypothetical protein
MRYVLPEVVSLRPQFERDGFVAVAEALPVSLTRKWRQHAEKMKAFARTILRRERGSELAYRVVTGDDIRSHWPELFALYNNRYLLAWLKNITGDNTIQTSQHLESALNLNILDTSSFVYRWHFDAVPFTVILYLTGVLPQDGGALRIIPNCRPHVAPDICKSKVVEIRPTAGTILVMDGTRCYHSVAPMLRKVLRLSIPLVYPNREGSTRPSGLDSYLYDRAA